MLTLCMVLGSFAWTNQPDSNVQLWGTAVSPYVRKIISVLEEKKVSYTLHPILPSSLLEATGQEVPVEFKQISPLGKIPAIQVDDFAISDSAVIAAYIEKKWPEIAIYPKKPEEFAKAIWYERYSDTVMTDVFHKIIFEKYVKPNVLKAEENKPLIAELIDKLPTIFRYLEDEFEKNKGEYLVGSTISIADIAVMHHFVSLQIAGVNIDLKEYPLLSTYVQHMLKHASIQAAISSL